MASFRFCETYLLHIKPFVVNKSVLVHLHRHYNPSKPNQTNWSPCAFAGMHQQPRLALCAFADPLAQSHWSPCAFTGTHLQTHGAPCAFTWMHHHSSWTLFITQNGYPHSPYTRIRLQKTCSPTPASVITVTARKCGGVLTLISPLPRHAEGFTTCKLRLSYEARSPAAPCRLLSPAHW